MKNLLNHPFLMYAVACIACLCIMIIIDYILGKEAEHLNAWVILNRLFGNKTDIGDSLAIQHFGLVGATFLMIFVNALFGIILFNLLKLFIRIVHS